MKNDNEKKKLTTDMKIFIAVVSVIAVIIVVAIVYLVMPKDVAIVNNGKITADEFKFYYYQNLSYLLPLGGQTTDQEALINYAKQLSLSQAVETEYLLQEAKKSGFSVDNSELNEQWKTMEENIVKSASDNNISVDEFCKNAFGIGLINSSIFKDSYIAQIREQE